MYKNRFNKCETITFRRFLNKGYALFSCLGKEVIVGTLSVATLTYAKADGISTRRSDIDPVIDEKEVTLDEVEVNGSLAPLTSGKAARMVTVLTREEIQAVPVQSVNDLLKYAVAVDVRQRGALGAQTDIGIRGGTQEQVAVLLNGIDITDPHTGHNSVEYPVDLSEIERIEIIEGPASRLFGTSSLVGAINIVTKPAEKSSISLNMEGGSFGYFTAGGRANARTGKFNNQISGSYKRSDGFSRSKSGALNADFKGGKAFYQGVFDDSNVGINWQAGMSIKDFGSNTFYGTGSDTQFEHLAKTFVALQGESKGLWLHIKPALYWNRTYDRFEYFRGSAERVPYNYHLTNVLGAKLNLYFDTNIGRTAFGASYRNEDIVSGNLGEPLANPKPIGNTDRYYTKGLNRSDISFHLEHNVLLKDFTLSAGFVLLKNTWNKRHFGFYPGIDASYRLGEHFKLFASWNTSLRTPTFTELYYNVGGHIPNPFLNPEELSAVEGGVKYTSRGIYGSMSIYHNRYKNMIDWIKDEVDGKRVWRSVNFTKVNTIGVESNVMFNLKELLPRQNMLKTLQLAYNYIDQNKHEVEDIVTESKQEYLRHKFVASLQMHLVANLDLGLNFRHQKRNGSYTDLSGKSRKYEAYSLLDARLSWNKPHYTIYTEVNNLTDKKDYIDFGNIPQPGLWVTAGVNVKI
ncbi:MAG: TonB-dependent receptor [Prevotella sp.]|uniref:TonB-dependent receptor n=1 Tax=Prevotella sp. TaxID=59823 RepID=UPI002A2678F0|nr:TonB-dependent receptor [Prevotella sp.]MDD7318684.1 TonB-dependent receptor [Prevotellaceae bacterium]MDY4019360.1 TonB-dependent receptor [Prevotella sp.]